MNWIDISILSVVGLSILIGIFRGFIREALSLVNWGLAIGGGVYFHDTVSNYLSNTIHSEMVRSVIAFGGIFLTILIICSLISHLISALVKKSGLGGTDRVLGLVFGFLRGALVCSVMLLIISFSPIKSQSTWQQAILLPYFKPVMAWLNDNVPEQVNIAKQTIDKPNKDKATDNPLSAKYSTLIKQYQAGTGS